MHLISLELKKKTHPHRLRTDAMTNEEIQKTMEFILEQQAQFAANIQRLQEERLRDSPRLTRLEESFRLLVQLAQTTDTRLDTTDTRLGTTDTRLDTLESNMAILAAAQAHSEERLSALIDIVREGRNGK
jgi:DNA repair exonuclease SbcCD ATPase subunit